MTNPEKQQHTYVQKIGNRGEQTALQFLLDKGYEECAKNYHSGYGEIDLIVKNSECIVFVEVKTRNNRSPSRPAEAVTLHKQQCIIKTAVHYLTEYPTELQPRFDVVEVIYSKVKHCVTEVSHIENAFYQNEEYAVF